MNGTSLLLAIIGHLVGDYLLQNDWMATNKKTSSLPCSIHCLIWSVSVCWFSGWFLKLAPADPAWNRSMLLVWLLLFVTHFAQDRTQIIRFWMTRINRQSKFVEPPMAPWSLVVVDNVWHIVTLWAVWRWIA